MQVSRHGIKAADGSVVFRGADEVNAVLAIQDYTNPPPFIDEVVEFVTAQPEQFVRFHNPLNRERSWMMKLSDVENFANVDQIRNAYSIPVSNEITQFSIFNVPAGTTIYSGTANEIESIFEGGGLQFFINDTVESSWVQNTEPIAAFFD